MTGAAVRKIVTGNRGNDDIIKPQFFYGRSDPFRLCGIDRGGTAMSDAAESAAAGADIAEDHEGQGVLRETFSNVGAFGRFADRVKAFILDKLSYSADVLQFRRLFYKKIRKCHLIFSAAAILTLFEVYYIISLFLCQGHVVFNTSFYTGNGCWKLL